MSHDHPAPGGVDHTGSIRQAGSGLANTGVLSIRNTTVVPSWVLGLVGVLVPPALVLGLAWTTMLDHPIGITIGLLGYLAAVTTGVAAYRVLSRPTADRLDHVSRAAEFRASRYGRRYREWFRHSSGGLQKGGFTDLGDVTLKLYEVYVDVSLVPRPPGAVGQGVLDTIPVDVTERRDVWDFVGAKEPTILAVLGTPGGGKSTLLRHIGWRLTGARFSPRLYPILLELREHGEHIVADPRVDLADLLRTAIPRLSTPAPEGWWSSQLGRGLCVVMLDGLDEVVLDADRATVSSWIDDQTSRYYRNTFVITSRRHGFRGRVPRTDRVVQIRPFTDRQVAQFLTNWYTARATRRVGATKSSAQAEGRASADSLLHRLAENPALRDLTINPLLLTLIANVHRPGSELPANRVELYAEVCRVVLTPRGVASRVPQVSAGQLQNRLAAVAALMMRQQTTVIRHADVIATLGPAASSGLSGADLLTAAVNSGMVRPERSQLYSFAHLTFQEYLAAEHFRANAHLAELLEVGVDDPWWHETIVLWASGNDANGVIRACLNVGSINALSLALSCIDNAACVDPRLESRLQRRLNTAYTDTADAEHRRLVAGVEAIRYLRRFVTLGTGTRVCREPIPASLYWLFTRDQGTRLPVLAYRPAQPPSGVATGMWGGDAVQFVRWINSLISGAHESTCRLPTAAELDDLPAEPEPGATAPEPDSPVIYVQGGAPGSWPSTWHGHGEASENAGVNELAEAVGRDARLSPVPPYLATVAVLFQSVLIRTVAAAVHERATRLTNMLNRNLKSTLDYAVTALAEAESQGSHGPGGGDRLARERWEAIRHEINRARQDVESLRRAVRRATDPTFDVDHALSNLNTVAWDVDEARSKSRFERREEVEPGRARLISARMTRLVAEADTVVRRMTDAYKTSAVPQDLDEAATLWQAFDDVWHRLTTLWADLDRARFRDADQPRVGAWTRIRDRDRSLQRGARNAADTLERLAQCVKAIERFDPSADDGALPIVAIGKLPTFPSMPGALPRDLVVTALTQHVGAALAEAVVAAVSGGVRDASPVRTFARQILPDATVRQAEEKPFDDLERLTVRVRDHIIQGTAWPPFAKSAARQLSVRAHPVFTRAKPADPDTCTAVRILALALAAEAVKLNAPRMAATLRCIALGITRLELRSVNPGLARERIVLARTQE